ncbi:MAG: hypothetical protein GXN94_01835 [Aquificae bacterium]|nr:hypothetical protein [Aquificota bacterium]
MSGSIRLKIDKEALYYGYIWLEAVNSKPLLQDELLEEIENEYGVYGQLVLNKDYELVFLDHAVLRKESLEDLKQIPINGSYSIPELNIHNVDFKTLISAISDFF